MVDGNQMVVIEVALRSSGQIFVHQEITIVIELTEVVVEAGNINCTCVIVLEASGIAVVYLYRAGTGQLTTAQHDELRLVDHIQRYA